MIFGQDNLFCVDLKLNILGFILYKKTQSWFTTIMKELTKKKIVIIGSGGHGVMSLSELLKHPEYDHYVYFNTGDWGGSWGLWGRLLEFNDNELNKLLHSQTLEVLPFADMNKAICYFVNLKENINEKLDELPDLEQKKSHIQPQEKEFVKRSRNTNKCVLDFRAEKLHDHKLPLGRCFQRISITRRPLASLPILTKT